MNYRCPMDGLVPKNMKRISDITREQAVIIAKLAYIAESITSSDEEFHFQYCPYNKGDAAEYIFVKFYAITFGNRVDMIRFWIHPNLNCDIDYYRDNKDGSSSMDRLPLRNQWEIFQKFQEWDIVPTKDKKE